MKVLQFQEVEDGERLCLSLHKKYGVVFETLCGPVKMGTSGEFSGHYSLYQYKRPSNGEWLWVIELEMFQPPDMQWYRSWVVDEQPNSDQIATIIAANAQTGSFVA